jgi:hypothetical protein
MRNAVLAGLLVGLVGCADEAADEGGAGGAGGQPADMGMAPEGTTETFTFTELALAQPAALSGILNNLLTNSLNAGDIIILMQVDGWDGNGNIVLRGGAGQQVAGLDTPADFADDGFTWLTEGQCAAADGSAAPCSVEISEQAGTQTGDTFTMTGGEIFIYSADLQLIIPIRSLDLSGTRTGDAIEANLTGVVTDAEAAEMRFKLSPDAPMPTDLKSLLNNFNIDPDTDLDGQPAYTFQGTFAAELITFVAP